jgi:hypothetical protein
MVDKKSVVMTVVADQTQKSLTREQKEGVGLLSIGTFLEYLCVQLRRLC